MKVSSTLLVLLLFASLIVMFPNVHAQSTRIYEVVHPTHSTSGSMEPIIVTATVFYNDTAAGSSMIVGILDADKSPQAITPGIATSSPDSCVGPVQLAALCQVSLKASSGAEQFNFRIGGILGGRHNIGTWDLNMTAALFDQNGKLIPGSVSTVPFAIQLTPLAFQVTVPTNVAISIDGVTEPAGPVLVGVQLGYHNITAPLIVQVDPTTRMRFDQWSDGSTDANRTVLIQNDTSLTGRYVTQYLLTITGQQATATGAGWYDENSTAKFSVSSSEQMLGLPGSFGVKLKFQGWYENGTLITNSPAGTIVMTQPHTITVMSQPDYSATAVLVVLVIIIGAAYLIDRRRTAKPVRRRKTRKYTN